MVIGDSKITIIQGDSYERYITFEGVDLNLIEGVYFSSEKLGIVKKLFLNHNIFILSLTAEETMNFPIMNATYDLTVKFIENKVNTVQYQAVISILSKNNRITL